ncbi:hypothetical protein BDZ89DRAFT_1043847 [Hymenopellis radicata]|nr:hypothetical protein BDZ89DRAFT_1043847 [Hymenopellis radicata]
MRRYDIILDVVARAVAAEDRNDPLLRADEAPVFQLVLGKVDLQDGRLVEICSIARALWVLIIAENVAGVKQRGCPSAERDCFFCRALQEIRCLKEELNERNTYQPGLLTGRKREELRGIDESRKMEPRAKTSRSMKSQQQREHRAARRAARTESEFANFESETSRKLESKERNSHMIASTQSGLCDCGCRSPNVRCLVVDGTNVSNEMLPVVWAYAACRPPVGFVLSVVQTELKTHNGYGRAFKESKYRRSAEMRMAVVVGRKVNIVVIMLGYIVSETREQRVKFQGRPNREKRRGQWRTQESGQCPIEE